MSDGPWGPLGGALPCRPHDDVHSVLTVETGLHFCKTFCRGRCSPAILYADNRNALKS